jgi:hypothetical protein
LQLAKAPTPNTKPTTDPETLADTSTTKSPGGWSPKGLSKPLSYLADACLVAETLLWLLLGAEPTTTERLLLRKPARSTTESSTDPNTLPDTPTAEPPVGWRPEGLLPEPGHAELTKIGIVE